MERLRTHANAVRVALGNLQVVAVQRVWYEISDGDMRNYLCRAYDLVDTLIDEIARKRRKRCLFAAFVLVERNSGIVLERGRRFGEVVPMSQDLFVYIHMT
jgi:hypothetical protein